MRKVVMVLILLVSSVAMAQNNASIVSSVTLLLFDKDCLISGEGVECIQPGKVRVPMGLTIVCGINNGKTEDIEYTVNGSEVSFVIGEATSYPRILLGFNWENKGFYHISRLVIYVLETASSGYILFDGVGGTDCETLRVDTEGNFSAAGNEWKVTPVITGTPAVPGTVLTMTLESLIFERQ